MEPNQTPKKEVKEVKVEPKQVTAPKEVNGENLYLSNAAWMVVLGIILVVALVSYFVKPSTIADAWRSMFSRAEVISVKLSASAAEANKPITLTYEHKNQQTTGDGNYYLSYSCSNGLSLSVVDGKTTEVICGRPFEITNFSTSSLNVVKTLAQTKATTSPATKGPTSTVKPTPKPTTSKPTTGTTPTPTVTPTPTAVSRQPGAKTERFYQIDPSTQSAIPTPNSTIRTGSVDLAVTVLAIGKIEAGTNRFTPTATLKSTDRIAVQFEIANNGTEAVTDWTFATTLPIDPPYTFMSEKQQVLTPGDYIVYTIGFDHFTTGDNVMTIVADPDNVLAEITKANNVGIARFDGVTF
ncbi:MAG: hypothetical protein HYV68_00780 [Candidatus Taylorbacteria bacterium]|nr:hypothetical protein [Candidatus Taylorbacteria bacterium]